MENSRYGNSGFGLPNIENARFSLPLSKIKNMKFQRFGLTDMEN